MADLTGKTLGNYRILEQVGRGGMATVFKAYQPSLERYVAIKVIHEALAAEDDQFSKRFQREAKAVAALRHPNIVQVFDFGTEGVSYMVMEYLEGTTLKAELKALNDKGQLMPLDEVQRIFQAVASAVDYAAGQGMVHRDLKPGNVMLTSKGDVILTDFGIARIAGGTQYTTTGAVMGTPAYMSPEQGKGERGDQRSDIYSLGVMLYEMVTGRVPFEADTPLAVIFKHISDPLPLPHQINPAVPEKLEQVILKALAKNPDDRYQRAADLARALTEALATDTTQVAPKVEAPAETPVSKTLLPRDLPAQPAMPAVARPAPARPARSAIPRVAWAWVVGVAALAVLLVAGFLGLNRLRNAPGSPPATFILLPAVTAPPTAILPLVPGANYASAAEVSVILGKVNTERGLEQFDYVDGVTTSRDQGGRESRGTVPNRSGAVRYMYFRVADEFINSRRSAVWVRVEYLDQGHATFGLQYDSADSSAAELGSTKPSRQVIQLGNSGQWRIATFVLPDAFFGGRQNSHADFRLATADNDLYVRSVSVVKPPAAYLVRLRVSTTSDWTTVSMVKGAIWSNPTLVSSGPEGVEVGLEGQTVRLAQPVAQAQAGRRIEMIVDVLLTDVSETVTLEFGIGRGNIGSTTVDLFNFVGAEPILVDTVKWSGDTPDAHPVSLPAAKFLNPPP